jgi:hypothetical protein
MPKLAATILILLFIANSAGAQQAPPATASTVPAAPPGVEDPQAYAEFVGHVIEARERRRQAMELTAKRLKELSQPGIDPKVADAGKRDLLIQRRLADLEAERAKRAMDLFWFERTLPVNKRAEFLRLEPADQTAVLETRSAAQRLAVPLPPANFSATSAENVLAYIQQESGVRVVGDWPSLAAVKMERRTPISIEIGRYNRPALDSLRSVLDVLSKGRAKIDGSWPDAVVITTDIGLQQRVELRRKVRAQVVDLQAWDVFGAPLDATNLEKVPLADALIAGIPATEMPPLYVDWAALATAGITAQTPVDLRLGVHTIAERLAVLAEAVSSRAEVAERGGMRFDIHPIGEIILSTGEGYRRLSGTINRLTNAAKTDAARAALQGRIPEVVLNRVSLQDTIDFFRDATRLDIRADWNGLAASGLTPQTPVNQKFYNAPLGFALAIVLDTPPDKPPVQWEVEEGRIIARGGRR